MIQVLRPDCISLTVATALSGLTPWEAIANERIVERIIGTLQFSCLPIVSPLSTWVGTIGVYCIRCLSVLYRGQSGTPPPLTEANRIPLRPLQGPTQVPLRPLQRLTGTPPPFTGADQAPFRPLQRRTRYPSVLYRGWPVTPHPL